MVVLMWCGDCGDGECGFDVYAMMIVTVIVVVIVVKTVWVWCSKGADGGNRVGLLVQLV